MQRKKQRAQSLRFVVYGFRMDSALRIWVIFLGSMLLALSPLLSAICALRYANGKNR